MNKLKTIGWGLLAQAIVVQNSLAMSRPPGDGGHNGGGHGGGHHGGGNGGSTDVPELDGPAGVLAAGLLVSFIFYVREKIRRK